MIRAVGTSAISISSRTVTFSPGAEVWLDATVVFPATHDEDGEPTCISRREGEACDGPYHLVMRDGRVGSPM